MRVEITKDELESWIGQNITKLIVRVNGKEVEVDSIILMVTMKKPPQVGIYG